MRWLLWLALALVGCDGSRPPADGGGDGGGVRDAGAPIEPPDAPAPPTPPEPPRFAPCPDGWTEATERGVTICRAFAAAPPACAEGEIARPGAPGCAPLGAACPADGLPPDPGGDVRWVRAGASGDGSRGAPFGTIAEALVDPGSSTTVAIGVGTYDEPLDLPAGARLLGACASETILTHSGGTAPVAREGAVTLEELSIVRPEGFGPRSIGVGTLLRLRRVRVEGARGIGLLATDGGDIDAEDVTVVGTRVREDGTLGRGVQVQEGSELSLRRAMVASNLEYGIVASNARLSLQDVLLRDVASAPADGADGFGVLLVDRATASLERVVVADVREAGVFATNAGTSLEATSLVIDGVRRSEAGTSASTSLIVSDEATATVSRLRVAGPLDAALRAAGATLNVRDALVVGPRDGAQHALLSVVDGARVEGDRVVLVDASWNAISVMSARARLRDLVVRDTEPVTIDLPDGMEITSGSALSLDFAAEVDVERARLTGLSGQAVFSTDDARLALRDVRIDGVRRDGRIAHGLALTRRSSTTLERVAITDVEGEGVFVEDGPLEATDLTVGPPTGPDVVGFAQSFVATDAQIMGDRWALSGGLGIGLELWRTEATLGAVYVEDAGERVCPPEGCIVESPDRFGMGLGIYDGSAVTIASLYVVGSAFCGVHLDAPSALEVEGGLIAGNGIGVCAHGGEAQLAPLLDGIEFRDNELSVDTATLALPMPPTLSP